jgi:hypothetical protein
VGDDMEPGAVIGVRKILAGIIAGFLISAAAYADMAPVSAPDAGPRQSSHVWGRTDLQYTNSPNITGLDLWSVAFLPRPNADVRQTSPIQYPPSLTDGLSSFSLCLYALMGLGLVRSAPWVKKLSLGSISEWYHDGGPYQIGLSQAWLSAIRELALHIASKRQTKQECPGNVTGVRRDEHCRRTRSNIERTRYIGLLRHLAGIPDVIVSYSAVVLHPSLRVSRSGSGALRASAVRAHLAPPEFALVRLASDTIKPTSCLACAAEQPVRFSPAFIFSNLARGPPKSA